MLLQDDLIFLLLDAHLTHGVDDLGSDYNGDRPGNMESWQIG